MKDDWILGIRSEMDALGGLVYIPNSSNSFRDFSLDRIIVGKQLGLLSDETIIEIELIRLNNNVRMTAIEVELALLLREDSLLVSEILNRSDVDFNKNDLFWFRVILQLFVSRWKNNIGEPLEELQAFADAWGGQARSVTLDILPRRIDRFYFGVGARERFVAAAADWLRHGEFASGQ